MRTSSTKEDDVGNGVKSFLMSLTLANIMAKGLICIAGAYTHRRIADVMKHITTIEGGEDIRLDYLK